VILGWRDLARLQVPLDHTLTRRGVRFVRGEVRELYADKCEVRTESENFPYDIVLIASGAELDYAAVPGLVLYTYLSFCFSDRRRCRLRARRTEDSQRLLQR
jgi:NADH dehydrogenase FAD-containing subunit